MPINLTPYKPGQVKIIGPSVKIEGPDIINKFADSLIKIEDDRLKTINANFENMSKLEDSLLNIDSGSILGQETLDKYKQKHGLTNDDMFRWTMEELENPYKVSMTKSAINKFLAEKDVQNVIKDAAKIKQLEEAIPKMDPALANVAKRDLINIKNSVKNDDGIPITINDVNINDYTKINLDKIITDEFKNLPKDIVVEKDGASGGYILYNKKTKSKITEVEFINSIIDKYSNDPRVRNNLRALVDPTKPDEDKKINDKNYIKKVLTEKTRNIFERYNDSIKDSYVKKDLDLDYARRLALKNAGKNSTNSTPKFKTSDYGKIGAAVAQDLYEQGYSISRIDAVSLDNLVKEHTNYTMKREGNKYKVTYEDDVPDEDGNFKRKTVTREYELTPFSSTSSNDGSDYVPNYDDSGLDFGYIRQFEQFNPKEGGVDTKYITKSNYYGGNGVYSVGDEGRSFGSLQMHGDTWNGFLDYLSTNHITIPKGIKLGDDMMLTKSEKIKQLKKAYPGQDISYELKAWETKKKDQIDNVLNFIEKIGPEKFRDYENKYMYTTRYAPAIKKASQILGKLSNADKTFVADIANQHGNYPVILKNAAKLKKEKRLSNLEALKEARAAYLKANMSYSTKDQQRKVDNIIENRYNRGYRMLLNDESDKLDKANKLNEESSLFDAIDIYNQTYYDKNGEGIDNLNYSPDDMTDIDFANIMKGYDMNILKKYLSEEDFNKLEKFYKSKGIWNVKILHKALNKYKEQHISSNSNQQSTSQNISRYGDY